MNASRFSPLNYAMRLPRSWRLPVRWMIVLAVCFAAVLTWHRYGKPLLRYVDTARSRADFQQQCLSYDAGPDTVVFDETLTRQPVGFANSSTIKPSEWRSNRMGSPTTHLSPTIAPQGTWIWEPQCWRQLRRFDWMLNGRTPCAFGIQPDVIFTPSVGTRYTSPLGGLSSDIHDARITCYLHRRRSASGSDRLVVVLFDAGAFIWGDPKPFSAQVLSATFSSQSLLLRPKALSDSQFTFSQDMPLRLFAGQSDPIDQSHFTIKLEAGGRVGVIDGWLQPDDTITLELQE